MKRQDKEFYNRVVDLLELVGTNFHQIAIFYGNDPAKYYQLSTGKYPRFDTLMEIVKFLKIQDKDISLEYLFLGKGPKVIKVKKTKPIP